MTSRNTIVAPGDDRDWRVGNHNVTAGRNPGNPLVAAPARSPARCIDRPVAALSTIPDGPSRVSPARTDHPRTRAAASAGPGGVRALPGIQGPHPTPTPDVPPPGSCTRTARPAGELRIRRQPGTGPAYLSVPSGSRRHADR
jgi:hypothetical protein